MSKGTIKLAGMEGRWRLLRIGEAMKGTPPVEPALGGGNPFTRRVLINSP